MIRRTLLALCCAAALCVLLSPSEASGPAGLWPHVGPIYNTQDWNRLYHYPYVYYPQNFWSSEYYKSSDDMYHRYPPEMRVPVYNKQWHNMYPEGQLYHTGTTSFSTRSSADVRLAMLRRRFAMPTSAELIERFAGLLQLIERQPFVGRVGLVDRPGSKHDDGTPACAMAAASVP